jgi:hypothetical protein
MRLRATRELPKARAARWRKPEPSPLDDSAAARVCAQLPPLAFGALPARGLVPTRLHFATHVLILTVRGEMHDPSKLLAPQLPPRAQLHHGSAPDAERMACRRGSGRCRSFLARQSSAIHRLCLHGAAGESRETYGVCCLDSLAADATVARCTPPLLCCTAGHGRKRNNGHHHLPIQYQQGEASFSRCVPLTSTIACR